jgi:hypothetical protein
MDNVNIKVIFEGLYSFPHRTKTTDELQKQWARCVLSNQHMQMFPHEWSDSEDRGRHTDADTDPDSDTDIAIAAGVQGLTHPKQRPLTHNLDQFHPPFNLTIYLPQI